jgi:hypothetical protein
VARPNSFSGLIDQWEPKLQRAFLDAVQNMRGRADIAQLTAMLEASDIEGALRAVGLDPVSFRVFDRAFTNAFEAGGEATALSIPVTRAADGFKTVFQFNVRNLAAESWLRDYSSSLIRDVFDDQRQMIRNVLTDGLAQGANPLTTALDLVGRIGSNGERQSGLIGLTDSQAGWVRKYAEELASDKPTDALARALRDARFDKTVLKAAKEGRALTPSEIGPMVKAYVNRSLRYRAETIARKETITALHTAQEQSIQQAIRSGAVRPDTLTYIWRAAHDKRVRSAHRALDGQRAKQGQPFHSILGPIRYPGDPQASPENTINCRCTREISIDFLHGIR